MNYWHSLRLGRGPLCVLPRQTFVFFRILNVVSLKAVKPELDGCRSCICMHRRNTVGLQDWVKHQYCSCPGSKICFLLFLLNNDVLFNTHSQFDHISFILWSNTNRQQVDSLQLGSILSIETWTTLLLRPSVPFCKTAESGSLCLSTTCGLGYFPPFCIVTFFFFWSTLMLSNSGAHVQASFTMLEDFASAVHMQRCLDSQVSLSDTEWCEFSPITNFCEGELSV